MRRKDSSRISINEQTITVDKHGHSPYIDFNNEDANIIILAYQPGIGKTYNVLKFMEQNPNCFYFTDRHKVIEDNTRKWDEINVVYAHWEGHERKCSNAHLRGIVKNYNLAPTIACSHCNRGRCSYRGQFTNRNRVFAPFEYLPSNYVMGELPDTIFLDESKVIVYKVAFNQIDTISWLEVISRNSDMPDEFIDLMRDCNYWFFIYGGLDAVAGYHRQAQETAFVAGNLNLVREIGRINPYNLSMYFKFAETYDDFQRESFHIPLWYYAFEVVNRGTRVVLLDATFNKDWFKYMLECFNGEVGFNDDISVQIYTTNITNRNTIVYNMRHGEDRGSWIPKVSVKGHVMRWFPQHLKKIKEIYGEGNVGLITFKVVKELKSKRYAELFDNQYFGNLRSSNVFENKRVLVVLGTYFGTENQVFEHLKEIFDMDERRQIVEQEEIRRDYENRELSDWLRPQNPDSPLNTILNRKRRRRFTDSATPDYMGDGNSSNFDNWVMPVMWIQKGVWDSEMYQAFHRNRGLQHNRIIFAYCWFPPDILEEFNVISVNRGKSEEQAFWNEREVEEKERRLMDSLFEEISLANRPRLMKTYLSENYRMFGRDNRGRIERFITHYLELKERIKPPRK